MFTDPQEDMDMFFTVLSNDRRRFCVRFVHQNDPTTLGAMADELAAVENTARKDVYANLYQKHILKLDASDIVDYDDRSKDITKGHNHAAAMQILDCVSTTLSGSGS
jgi:hypothetical protein